MTRDGQFGRYRILKRLGRSMADVYLAEDTVANRRTALKIVEKSTDPARRLVLEAERRGADLQRRLREYDPRVLEIYECGEEDGCFFVAMQYAEGRTVAEVLEREGRMDPWRAAAIAVEIASQLEKFHEVPVVHGDIKPANVQLGPDDTVRLLDFGIAKSIRAGRDYTFHNFGSPNYCSPERLGDARVDHQADLWSVGVTLYEMIAGKPPYQAENTRKLERLIQSRRPPRALPPSCPLALRGVVTKALAGRPERRYATAADLRRDLESFLAGRETEAARERRAAWRALPTVEKHRQEPRHQVSVKRILAMTGCLLFGMFVFIATSFTSRYVRGRRAVRVDLDWRAYRELEAEFAFMGRWSPVNGLKVPLHNGLLRAADWAIAGRQWKEAREVLDHARELTPVDKGVAARLALVAAGMRPPPPAPVQMPAVTAARAVKAKRVATSRRRPARRHRRWR